MIMHRQPCNVCRGPRNITSPTLLMSHAAANVPLCDACVEAIGRAWQADAFEVIEEGYRRRYPNGAAGCLHDDAREAGQLDEVSEREFAGSRLVKVTTRRRVKP